MKKILLTLMTIFLIACSTDTQTSKDKENKDITEITYWYSWQDKIAENNIELTKKFNETIGKEKGIKVTAEYQGTYNDLHAKLRSAFVAKEEPAVSVMEIASIKAFADGGIIAPLTDVISKEKEKNFLEGLMDNSYVDGKLYAVPYLRSTPIFYYNKTLFEKVGIEKAPTNWKELKEASLKLKKIGVAGFGFQSDIWHFEAFIKGNGGNTINNDETALTINTTEVKELIEFLRDGVANYNFKYYTGSDASNSIQTDILNNKTAMWIASTGSLGNNLDIAKENGYEINTAFIPAGKAYKVPTGGANLVMTSRLDEKKKEAASEFINFMTDEKRAIESHKRTGYLPTLKTMEKNPEIIKLYKEIPQYKVALDQLQYGSGRPMNKSYIEAIKIFVETLDKLFTTDSDIQKELDTANQKANVILKEGI